MGNNTNETALDLSKERPFEWSSLGVHCYIRMFIIAALFCAIYWYELQELVHTWKTDPSWTHGFLIPLFSLYLIHQKRNEIFAIPARTSYFALFGLIFFILLYIFNTVQLRFAYGGPLIMLASLGAIVLFFNGWKRLKYLWMPVCYLFFAIPIPTRIYRELTYPLRTLASYSSAAILSLIPHVEATASNIVITVLYKGKAIESALNVAEACSGMRLLMAFVALGVAMAYLHERPMWQRFILLLSTVPIAIACNIVRVTITGSIYIFGNPKYAKGIYHDGLGLLMIGLAFIMYYLLAAFMELLFVEEDAKEEVEEIIIKRKK